MHTAVLYWPGTSAAHVPIWRLLELSGLTKSTRESEIALKAGAVRFNGNLVMGKRTTAKVDAEHTLSLVDGVNSPKTVAFRLANQAPVRSPRPNTPFTVHRKP